MMPFGEIIPVLHFFYYQINIPEIPEPFIQEEGEIYWLVITIDAFPPQFVGWKNSLDYFMDHAVWNDSVIWMRIDGIDFAFVITGEPLPPPIPAVGCDGELLWTGIKPGATVTGSFNVSNVGEPLSKLNWTIDSWPDWGTWTFNPDDGTDLTPEDGKVNVQVTVVAPKGEALGYFHPRDESYTGQVKVVNTNDNTDFCTIDVSMTTPKNKPFIYSSYLFSWLFARFPNAFPFLQYIVNK
jgi:hypothetical protein